MTILNKVKEILGLQPKQVEWVNLKDQPETPQEAYLRGLNEVYNSMLNLNKEMAKGFDEIKNELDEFQKILER